MKEITFSFLVCALLGIIVSAGLGEPQVAVFLGLTVAMVCAILGLMELSIRFGAWRAMREQSTRHEREWSARREADAIQADADWRDWERSFEDSFR